MGGSWPTNRSSSGDCSVYWLDCIHICIYMIYMYIYNIFWGVHGQQTDNPAVIALFIGWIIYMHVYIYNIHIYMIYFGGSWPTNRSFSGDCSALYTCIYDISCECVDVDMQMCVCIYTCVCIHACVYIYTCV